MEVSSSFPPLKSLYLAAVVVGAAAGCVIPGDVEERGAMGDVQDMRCDR